MACNHAKPLITLSDLLSFFLLIRLSALVFWDCFPYDKYLFYITGTKPEYTDVNFYQVSIDGVIESIKQTIVIDKTEIKPVIK